ncbi:hypothetical protein SCUP515_07806 [Seiridium cupressi]
MSDTDAFELTRTARKSAIAAEIWGPSSTLEAEQNRVAMLDSFFQCYEDEQESEEIDHTEVLAAIRILKGRPETKRNGSIYTPAIERLLQAMRQRTYSCWISRFAPCFSQHAPIAHVMAQSP